MFDSVGIYQLCRVCTNAHHELYLFSASDVEGLAQFDELLEDHRV